MVASSSRVVDFSKHFSVIIYTATATAIVVVIIEYILVQLAVNQHETLKSQIFNRIRPDCLLEENIYYSKDYVK